MSDVGNVRTINQDYVRYYQKNEHESLVVLCDGIGGHNAGEIASQMVGDAIVEQYVNHALFEDEKMIHDWMLEVVNHAHWLVKNKSLESPDLEGMGTTVVLALFKDEYVYVSHVGDSRAYLYRHHQLIQLTRDDTLVNVLVDSGTISKDEAFNHPQKNILLQAVGVSEHLEVSYTSENVKDALLLVCSDGLSNSLFDSQIIEILQSDIHLEEKGKQLMEAANTFGGKDNIGFALILNEGVVNNESDK